MRKLIIFLILILTSSILAKAQIPYFSGTVGDGNLYGYTSLKFRPGINAQETYTCFQYGISDYAATGVDIYTGLNSAYAGVLVRGGYKFNQWFGIGGQLTPSFDLNNSMKFSYLTAALYMNGSITNDGKLFWCSNTWLGVNKGAENTINQWSYLGYTIPTVGGQSITPMVGAIHSWKFDQEADLAVGAYYTIGKWNIYLWGNDFFKNNPRVVVGIDFTL